MKIDTKDDDIVRIKKILTEYYGINRFEFKKYLTFSGVEYKINFQPHYYYFIFSKKNNYLLCKSFFPNWSNEASCKKEKGEFEDNLIRWLKSIKKTQIRKNIINVSIQEGSEKRKQFEETVKKL